MQRQVHEVPKYDFSKSEKEKKELAKLKAEYKAALKIANNSKYGKL